jgi:putative oxidoreductase
MLDLLLDKTLVPLLLRLALAAIFIFHGVGKVAGKNPVTDASHEMGTNWNPSLPVWQQVLVAYGELFGGIALAIGFLTRLAAVGLGVIMAGAIATVHWPNGFEARSGGFEYAFALLAICLALVLMGGGVLSLDRLIFRRRRRTLPQRITGR